MKNFSSILGWLLLIAVMAVPSFLFYNWWSKSKQQAALELVREPVSGSVFPSDKNAQPAPARQAPPAPPAQQAKPAEAKPQEPAKTAAAADAGPDQAGGEPGEQPPSASSKPPDAAPKPARAPLVSSAAAPGAVEAPAKQDQVETSTAQKPVSSYEPKTPRDPTYSPDDYRRIKEDELRRAEAERQQRLAAEARKPREIPPETRISLQGIVGTAAIINGDMYSVGQSVRGIKIIKIGTDYIIGDYKGKRFKKVLK